MLDNPEILQTVERRTAVIRLTVARADIAAVMHPAVSEILSTLTAQGIAPSGPLFSYHLKRPSDIFDFEVGFPVDSIVTPAARVKTGKLPAAKVAHTVYHGGYEGLADAWGEFCSWIYNAGLSVQDNLWECYTLGPESSPDSADWRTELYRPLID